MKFAIRFAVWAVLGAPVLCPLPAQAPKPLQAQSQSSIAATWNRDGAQSVEIRNVAYEVTETGIPGRPPGDRLLLRKTIQSKQVLGDIGMEATVALEAWRFGDDPAKKPIYSLRISGDEVHTLDNAVLVASRGLEEVAWWSVYKLGSGQHLFDTYVPLLSLSISRETVQTRYIGLEVPPDDVSDTRLRQPNVVAVLTYAAGDRVIREGLLTGDHGEQGKLLRSYADVTRKMVAEEKLASRSVRISFTRNYPSPPDTLEVVIPIVRDDLDLAHAQLPQGLHVNPWRR